MKKIKLNKINISEHTIIGDDMNLTDGNLYFKNINKIKYKYEYLSEDIACDTLIVGGGITGAITAYYYALKGNDVVIIDKNIIGYGSTLATTAIMEYQIDEDLYKLSKDIGKKNALKCFKLCYAAIKEIEDMCKYIEIPFERQDSLYFTTKTSGVIKKEYEERKKHFNVSFENKNEVLKYKYAINLKNGSAIMDPYLFTSELINKLSKLDNVRVYENTEAIDIKDSLVTTNNGYKIKNNKCILTTGFETLDRLKENTIKLYRTFAIVTKPLSIKKPNFTARDIDNPYHYIRFTSDNRIIFGGEDIELKDYKQKSKSIYNKLYKTFGKYFPLYSDSEIEYEFNGVFANTKDTLPIIDKLSKNIYCNLGYGANGILYSVIGAKMINSNKILKIFKIR